MFQNEFETSEFNILLNTTVYVYLFKIFCEINIKLHKEVFSIKIKLLRFVSLLINQSCVFSL